MRSYTKHLRPASAGTPQTEFVPGREADQTRNNAGGVSFKASLLTRFQRFLVLGSDSPTYYASAQKNVRDGMTTLQEVFADPKQALVALELLATVSDEGRAPKNDAAILALAYAFTNEDLTVRRKAEAVFPKVVRIGTHMLQFSDALTAFGKRPGTGRLLRRTVVNWYKSKDPNALAYQLLKYQNRSGWTQGDVLRSIGYRGERGSVENQILSWAVGKRDLAEVEQALFEGVVKIREVKTAPLAAGIIRHYGLVRELVPTEFLNSPEVWRALLHAGANGMPLTAMVRNLGKMSSIGLLDGSEGDFVAQRLQDAEALKRSRLHPYSVLVAMDTYGSGQGFRGSLSWKPVSRVVDALDSAFYKSFGNVEPSNKRTMLALDVSGSMGFGYNKIAGTSSITPRKASAAMAMVTAAAEPVLPTILGFSHQLVPLDVSPRRRLDDNIWAISNLPFGATDCALPMIHATREGLEIDTFVVYTDSESFYGQTHPSEALDHYRKASGIDAKLIVVGMVSNGFTIADPKDPGMLDIVGFDVSSPNIMAAFSRGDF